MQRVWRMGFWLGLVMLVIGVAACGGDSTSTAASPTSAMDDLMTTTPPGTGELDKVTWNLPYEPSSLDWTRSFNYAENTSIANMSESLLRLTPDFSIEPGLAESFTNPTPTTWVYKIRQGVTFWDGAPMTADDVVYSLQRSLDPDVGSYFSFYFVNVDKIEKTADDLVTVTLKKPDALFNQAMASAAGTVGQRAYMESKGTDYGTAKGGIMGTGPFKFVEWQSGTSITMARNDAYWDTTLQPKVKSLELRFIADESTAVNALRSGQIDGQFFYTPPAGLTQLQTAPETGVYLGKSLVFWSLLTSATTGPYSDPRVRQALLAATDRAAIASVVFQGIAIPARVLAPPASWGYSEATFQAGYDAIPAPSVDAAAGKALLAEAGAAGETITIGAQGSSVAHSQTANILKAAGEEIGLNVNIKMIPVQRYGSLYWDPKAREGIDAFLSTWYGNFADPLDVYGFMGPGAPNNFNDYDNPEATRLTSEAFAEYDDAKRAETVVKLQKILTDDLVWAPLVYQTNILVMNKRMSGAVASFPYLYYPWAASIGGVQ